MTQCSGGKRHCLHNCSNFRHHGFSTEFIGTFAHLLIASLVRIENLGGKNSAKSLYRMPREKKKKTPPFCRTDCFRVVRSVSDSTLSVLQPSRAIVHSYVRAPKTVSEHPFSDQAAVVRAAGSNVNAVRRSALSGRATVSQRPSIRATYTNTTFSPFFSEPALPVRCIYPRGRAVPC